MTAVDVQGQKKNKFAAKVTKKVSTRTKNYLFLYCEQNNYATVRMSEDVFS
jgi:hypothetical protein